jgi:hypothetical protein
MSTNTSLDLPNQPSSSSSVFSIPSFLTSVQPSAAQMVTLSMEFLKNLLTQAFTAAAAVSSLNQAVAQLTIVVLAMESTTPPPFVTVLNMALPLGTSLFDRFPQVEAAIILEITQHDFKPMDLLKLDPAAQNKNMEWKATLDIEGDVLTATSHSGSLCNYPTFSFLLEPLLIYFSILTAYAALSGDMLGTPIIASGCNTYTSHLSALNCQFQWNTVLQYHKLFFLSRRREMTKGDYSGWSQPAILLMSEHVYGHPHIQNHPSSSEHNCPVSNSVEQPVAAQMCFAFNKGSCSLSPCPNRHIHKCQKCEGCQGFTKSHSSWV